MDADDRAGSLVVVDDLDDIRAAEYRDLNDPPYRRRLEAELGIVVVEGRVAVRQLLDSDLGVRSLLVDDHQVALADDLVAAVRDRGAPVFVVPRDGMAAWSGSGSIGAWWPSPTVRPSGRRRRAGPCGAYAQRRRRTAAGGGPRGAQRPGEHRRRLPQRRRLRGGRRPAGPDLRRPALPTRGPGLGRPRTAPAIRPPRSVARRPRARPCRRDSRCAPSLPHPGRQGSVARSG